MDGTSSNAGTLASSTRPCTGKGNHAFQGGWIARQRTHEQIRARKGERRGAGCRAQPEENREGQHRSASDAIDDAMHASGDEVYTCERDRRVR